MRHGKKINHLGRTASHRSAMLSNMASSLIKHKRITTTVAKAKALRKYVEPLITKSKDNSTNSRRVVFEYLQDKESITELFSDIAEKVANRPGGYTRILKTGYRHGDNAEMCIMELVDYNELMLEEAKPKVGKRVRRAKAKPKADQSEATSVVEEATLVEEDHTLEANTVDSVVEVDASDDAVQQTDSSGPDDAEEASDKASDDAKKD